MCSTGGDDGKILLEPKAPGDLIVGAVCRKCKERKAHIILQIKDAYCKYCFLALSNHKFRAILGKSRVFGNEPKSVIVAFSGSASSLALLKLLSDAVATGSQHRRIMADPKVVFIDEGALFDLSLVERTASCQKIREAVDQFGFPIYSVPLNLENVAPTSIDEPNFNKTLDSNVSALFMSLPDISSKVELLTRMRLDVLSACARHMGSSIVMFADTATSVAIKIISGMALGRGASIPLETSFCDDRVKDISFLRPIRDFTSKESALFCIFSGCYNPVFNTSFLTMTSADSSIQRLTEDFIVTLQNDFPSTVSTIYRTGDKFCVRSAERTCSMCLGPLDTSPKSCSALEATEFSREVSTEKQSGSCGSCNCKKGDVGKLLEALCYSCRLVARSMENIKLLPQYVLERAKESQAMSEMRLQIQEFLIEDSE